MERPKIIIHQLASVDGKLTTGPDTLLLFGDERWDAVAGSDEDAYRWVKSHFKPQAILEGSGSFMTEAMPPQPLSPFEGDPAPLYRDFLPQAVVQRPGQRGWFTVVDGRGRIRWLYKEYPGEEWQGWHVLVLVAAQTPSDYLAYLQSENIPYLVTGETQVDLCQALEKLGSLLNVDCVVSTAGGRLNGALLRTGIVDEVNIEFFPAIIGGQDTPGLFTTPALQPGEQPTRLKLISASIKTEGRVWLRYQVLASET